jgi:hypothetical protein
MSCFQGRIPCNQPGGKGSIESISCGCRIYNWNCNRRKQHALAIFRCQLRTATAQLQQEILRTIRENLLGQLRQVPFVDTAEHGAVPHPLATSLHSAGQDEDRVFSSGRNHD